MSFTLFLNGQRSKRNSDHDTKGKEKEFGKSRGWLKQANKEAQKSKSCSLNPPYAYLIMSKQSEHDFPLHHKVMMHRNNA